MAVDKLVDSAQLNSDLTAVADAIRAKTGKSVSMEFPSEFVSEIGSISGGGGLSFDDLASGDAPNGDVRLSVTQIIDYGLAIQHNVHIWRVIAPNVTKIGASAFRQCRKLTEIHLPSLTTISGIQHFYIASELQIIDLGLASSIPNGDFQNSKLNTLILRKTSAITALANINAFNSTPFASNGTGGTLYVPSDLIASYEAATNWSTILGYSNNSIQAIEGSIYETPLS